MIDATPSAPPRRVAMSCLACAVLIVAPHWRAEAAEAADQGPDPATIEKALPGLVVRSIAPTTVTGLFEVVNQDGDIFYTDESGQIGLFGSMVELSTRRNITAERAGEIRRVDFTTLPFELAIKRVYGAGSRRVAVFSDPDCPFCRQLETTLKEIDDVTIYVFPYPLEELHPGATLRARQIWCSADRVAAWEGWLLHGTAPDSDGDCDTPIDRIQQVAKQLLVSATPGLMFESGRNIAGAMPAEDIERFLNEPAASPGDGAQVAAPPSGG